MGARYSIGGGHSSAGETEDAAPNVLRPFNVGDQVEIKRKHSKGGGGVGTIVSVDNHGRKAQVEFIVGGRETFQFHHISHHEF